MAAERGTYLSTIRRLLEAKWPDNRTIRIVCHGHSVPAGYFATPIVDMLNAYPHLLLRKLKAAYPFAVVNVIVTAIGGEHAFSGAGRYERDVLSLCPDVVTIDYGLNDRSIGLELAETAWRRMIEHSLQAGNKVILLTPTWDNSVNDDSMADEWKRLQDHAEQIRSLASEYRVGLADSFAAFERYSETTHLSELLSWSNHPNKKGHKLVVKELMKWFV